MSTNRLEAFSDGVIAVAVTLLVLNIEVPAPGSGHSLGHELAHQWPTYAAYVTSFITIGIIWINHHAMISRLGRADHTILMLNLLLLLSIGVLPFGTNLIATYLREGHGENLAAAIYAGLFLAMSLAFANLNRHILFAKAHMLVATDRGRPPTPDPLARNRRADSICGRSRRCGVLALSNPDHLRRGRSVLRTADRQWRPADRVTQVHQAASARRQLSHPTADRSSSPKPAARSASSSFGVPATSPSGAGIVAPS